MRLLLLTLAAGTLHLAACDAQSRVPEGCGRHGAQIAREHARRPLPQLTGRVVDHADLLSAATEQRIVGQAESLEAATTDQLVVVTVRSLDGEPIESLGLRLGNGWGIGQENLDNGVLLIVAPRERRVRIEVGCGLEGLLTDERAQQIVNAILVPHFAEARYEEGISTGVANIAALLRTDTRRPQPWRGDR